MTAAVIVVEEPGRQGLAPVLIGNVSATGGWSTGTGTISAIVVKP